MADAVLVPAVESADTAVTPPPLPTIPGYTIERELGRGGMGAVYLARADDGQQFALKVLDLDRAEGTMADRFTREAEIGNELKHPDIVHIHGAGVTDDVAYIAMEYLSGFELTDAMRDSEFGLTDRVQVAVRVAKALDYAHSKGVLHRDIKPSNIFMTYDGQVRLLDFGIARVLSDVRLTKTGLIVGTPRYMSPEQLTAGKIDNRSDVFALGVVLFEALTGSTPWPAENQGRLVVDVCTKPPQPLTAFLQPGDYGLDAQRLEALQAIVLRAIEPEVAHRTRSAATFADELADFMRGENVSAPAAAVMWNEGQVEWARARAARLALEGGTLDLQTHQMEATDSGDGDESSGALWAFLVLIFAGGLAAAIYLWTAAN